MGSLSDLLSAIQNGVTATSNLNTFLTNTTFNSSSLRVNFTPPIIVAVSKQIFATIGTTTYFPTANMAYCIAEGVGGGGGSGGSSGSATTITGSAGGSGGGYARVFLTSSQVGSSLAVTVGAGGTAGAAGTNAGGNGGDTTLGSFLSAGGGVGSNGINASIIPTAPFGGTSTSGDIVIPGGGGVYGALATTYSGASPFLPSGSGGNSMLGTGGVGIGSGSGTQRGTPGSNYGGGAAGVVICNSATTSSGQVGAQGILIITEFLHA